MNLTELTEEQRQVLKLTNELIRIKRDVGNVAAALSAILPKTELFTDDGKVFNPRTGKREFYRAKSKTRRARR